ncbi:MAG: hypothetical protein BM556_16630 [Bacteriovorax sp. MedPE-SWde]|nr:MAG: hypothetical protein BM556_16630 [Bacteriovorax sp. MedPE-SWde]
MLLNKEFYYCKNCKKVVNNLEDLLFVEEGSPLSFCCEVCIEKYYTPITDYFQGKVFKLRKDLNLEEELALSLMDDPALVEKTLSRPDEIWRIENQIKEEVYSFITHIKKGEKSYHMMALCFVFNKTPSFVLTLTATENEYLLQQFQTGEQIESLEEFYKEQLAIENMIDPEILEHLELKKSQFLADLMEHRSEADIPFENFDLYMDYMTDTIETADEVYRFKDDEDETFQASIKGQVKDGVSFFFIVVSYHMPDDEGREMVLPILSFPTVDGKLCEYFRRGEQVSGGLKN